jgi:hypothetical protein
MRPLRYLTILFSVLATQNSWACYSPPSQQLMSVDEQIARASDVSVAWVINAVPLQHELVEYHFVVLERLAGKGDDAFTVTGRARASRRDDNGVATPTLHWPAAAGIDNETSVDNHTDPAFWKRGGGRVMNDTDCAIYPDFAVGSTYLVFLDTPWTRRSFEKIGGSKGITGNGDQWLAYVKAGLEKQGNRTPPES